MLSQDVKDLISVVTAVASAISAIAALGVAVWVYFGQRRLQRQQLRQDLFDRRFAVYVAIEVLMTNIVKLSGGLRSTDMGSFLRSIEPAEFLFGADVTSYLREMQDLVTALWEQQKMGTTQNSYGEDVVGLNTEQTAILKKLGALHERRNQVFRPYLLIHEE